MTLQTVKADITKLKMDAIVNAANSALAGGGGVDGAIHRAAGMAELNAACAKIVSCLPGQAVITPGFNLPAKYIIHTVGPVYRGSARDAKLLASCYEQSLDLAQEYKLRSIAFSAISTGVYGYPKKEAAVIAVNTVKKWLERHSNYSIDVVLVAFNDEQLQLYQALL